MLSFIGGLIIAFAMGYFILFNSKKRKKIMEAARKEGGLPQVMLYYTVAAGCAMVVLSLIVIAMHYIFGFDSYETYDVLKWALIAFLVILLVLTFITAVSVNIRNRRKVLPYDEDKYNEDRAFEDGLSIEEYRDMFLGYELWKYPERRSWNGYADWCNNAPDWNLPFRDWYKEAKKSLEFRILEKTGKEWYLKQRKDYDSILEQRKHDEFARDMKELDKKMKELKKVQKEIEKLK